MYPGQVSGFQFKMSKLAEQILNVISETPSYKVSGELVSIIVPTLEEGKYLDNLLESIRNQTYEPIEVIVVDADSTDDTVQIAKHYGAKVIRFSERNLAAAKNVGVSNALGNLLLFVDADCILPHNYVEEVVSNLGDGIVLTHGRDVSYEGGFVGCVFDLATSVKPFYKTTRGFCMRKEDFMLIGGFDERLNPLYGFREDLDIGIKVVKTFGESSIKYLRDVPIGTSVRRISALGTRCGNWSIVVR